MAASSSSSSYRYHAFLSFRGEDTRKAFADHLYTALQLSGIHTFRDDDEIKRGANIIQELQKAILESPVSIIVLSKSYASSRWCLNELVRIMEQQRASGHQVLPVFYDVDPKDVRNQSGSFTEAFSKHVVEQKIDKVQEWRRALGNVADMGGLVLGDQYESRFIQQIVHEAEKMLNYSAFNLCSNFVGMPYRLRRLNMWLKDGSNDGDIAVICGVGGIGKTTIARLAYNLNFYRFQGSSFLENIAETLEEEHGIIDLQRKLLTNIQRGEETETIDISSQNEGSSKIKRAVCCKKVLIVFDDVSNSNQFNAILGNLGWYCPGSKLIITTKDKHLLKDQDIPHIVFEVENFDEHESLELFCLRAFGEPQPSEGFHEITRLAVQYSGGHPLKLLVLAACLSRGNVDEWERKLRKEQKKLRDEQRKLHEKRDIAGTLTAVFVMLLVTFFLCAWYSLDNFKVDVSFNFR